MKKFGVDGEEESSEVSAKTITSKQESSSDAHAVRKR